MAVRSIIKITLIVLLVLGHGRLIAQTAAVIRPSTTDSRITTPDNPHWLYFNDKVVSKHKLFVFLPGTGATPFGYREILQTAANLGFHAIGLSYPNAFTINSLCGASSDSLCYQNARLEIIDGQDRNPDLIIDVPNSITHRLLSLLRHWHAEKPKEGWNQYYDANNSLLWERMILGGHSQGGGHAAVIGQTRQVDRVIMMASNDWDFTRNKSANWMRQNKLTSENRYFGFIHINDEVLDYDNVIRGWRDLGMFNEQTIVNADTFNYQAPGIQTFYTTLPPNENTEKFHASPVADLFTPKRNNRAVYGELWSYLLTTTVANGNQILTVSTQRDPNQISGLRIKEGKISFLNYFKWQYKIYDMHGLEIQSGTVSRTIDLSKLPEGLYLLNLNDRKSAIKVFKFIR